MPLVIILPLLPLIAVLLYAFILFDRLLRSEYQHHRNLWEADGRPAGFFWHAPECEFITSHLVRSRLVFSWLFRTPSWIMGSPEFTKQLRNHRWAVLLWNVGVLVWAVFFWRLT